MTRVTRPRVTRPRTLLSLSFFRYSRTLAGLISPRVVARAFLNSARTASMISGGISVFSLACKLLSHSDMWFKRLYAK